MKPAPFRYHRARDVADAIRAVAGEEDAVFLSGGQSLVPMLNLRLARPALLVDLNGCHELAGIRAEGAGLVIGGLTRHHALATDALILARNPLLAEAAGSIGYYPIRQRGTIGGSLAHADPAAQWPLMAVLFDAGIGLRGPDGTRSIAAAEFFLSVFATAREASEMITDIRFPALEPGEGWAYAQVSTVSGDFAIASAAATLTSDAAGAITSARLAAGAIADTPLRLDTGALIGARLTDLPDFARDAVAAIDIEDGARLSSEDRRDAAAAMIAEALTTAFGLAGAAS